ncbi:MAG: nucleotidyltransferase family protein [Acidobacteria bacterium]|nr:MAG: nucleotidyltransferase family protein [Acidobacteriota bacterium]
MSSKKARVAGVVLAAGPSSRFTDDLPKQLLELEGETLVRRIARRALESNLIDVVVVVGYREREIKAALGVLPLQVVVNPDFEQGQSTSVRAGLAEVRPDATAVMFLPVDQPFLTRSLIDHLIAVHEKTGAQIVVPAYEDQRGAPVLFDSTLFPELAHLTGDSGGRQLFPRHQEKIVEVQLTSREPLLDIDTPEDWERLQGHRS